MNVLVTAASRYGSTAEIATAIAAALRTHGHEVAVLAPEHVTTVEPYDAAVIGSAVYVGHWLKPALELVNGHGGALSKRPVWLFSSGPVGDPSRKLVQQMAADPSDLTAVRQATNARDHRMFAGKLDRSRLSFPQRLGLVLVRGLDGDWRNWDEIERWAGEIAEALAQEQPAGAAL